MSGPLAVTTASGSQIGELQSESSQQSIPTEGQQAPSRQQVLIQETQAQPEEPPSQAAQSSSSDSRPSTAGSSSDLGEEDTIIDVNSSTLATVPSTLVASSTQTSAVQPSEVVFGIPFNDKELSGVMRRVILIASFGATTYICRFIIDLLAGVYSERGTTELWSAMSSLFLELSVPACGYFGALHNNRQLMCCFCSCNLFISVITALSFVRLHIWASEMEGGCDSRSNTRKQQQTCELWVSNSLEKFVMMTSMVLVAVTGMVAFWFGNKLYRHLSQDFYISTPTPVVGQVTTIPTFAVRAPDGVVPQTPQEMTGIWRHGPSVEAGPQMASVTVEAAGVRNSTRHALQLRA